MTRLTKETFKDKMEELTMCFKPHVDIANKKVLSFWYGKMQWMDQDIFVRACDDAMNHLKVFPTISYFYEYHEERYYPGHED